jgi:indoleamine 2,3-dioxygenase
VLVYVDIVQNSRPLVDGVILALDACDNNNHQAFDIGIKKIIISITRVNKVMDGMSIPLLSFPSHLYNV